MVAKFMVMVLTTAGTAGMDQTVTILILGQRKKDKDDVEGYLQCV